MKIKFLNRIITYLLCLTAVIFMPIAAHAAGNDGADTGRVGSVTVTFKNDEKVPIEGADFSIYQIAEHIAGQGYVITPDFSKYSISLDDLDAENMTDLAMTLSAYVARDGLSPLAGGTTDAKGVVIFENIPYGLYLVTGSRIKVGNTIYTPQPFLLSIPTEDGEGGKLYDVSVDVKYESRDEEQKLIERKVLKVWKDNNGEERPNEITVQLLRDGEVFDEVVLNAQNNWRHTWSDLDPAYTWQIDEKEVPSGYTVSVSQEGITYVITNTYNPPSTPTPPPTPTPTDPPKLPQTGQMWWPVPVLAAGGFFICGLGIIIRMTSKRD